MDRRNFLGSVLGLVGGVPFLAKLPDQIWLPPENKALPYKVLFRDRNTGFTIQAPSVTEIQINEKSFTWICEPMHVLKTIVVDSMIIINKDGKFFDKPFSCPITLVNGDTLKAHATIETDVPVTIERAIKESRRKL